MRPREMSGDDVTDRAMLAELVSESVCRQVEELLAQRRWLEQEDMTLRSALTDLIQDGLDEYWYEGDEGDDGD